MNNSFKYKSGHTQDGFSLVEVVLALAVVALSLISIVGLLTVSLSLNLNSNSQTTATSIVSSIVADVRSTPLTVTSTVRYSIGIPATNQPLYFDIDGNVLPNKTGAIFAASITITPPQANVKAATIAKVMVYWPVTGTAESMHHIETTSVLDRN